MRKPSKETNVVTAEEAKTEGKIVSDTGVVYQQSQGPGTGNKGKDEALRKQLYESQCTNGVLVPGPRAKFDQNKIQAKKACWGNIIH